MAGFLADVAGLETCGGEVYEGLQVLDLGGEGVGGDDQCFVR